MPSFRPNFTLFPKFGQSWQAPGSPVSTLSGPVQVHMPRLQRASSSPWTPKNPPTAAATCVSLKRNNLWNSGPSLHLQRTWGDPTPPNLQDHFALRVIERTRESFRRRLESTSDGRLAIRFAKDEYLPWHDNILRELGVEALTIENPSARDLENYGSDGPLLPQICSEARPVRRVKDLLRELPANGKIRLELALQETSQHQIQLTPGPHEGNARLEIRTQHEAPLAWANLRIDLNEGNLKITAFNAEGPQRAIFKDRLIAEAMDWAAAQGLHRIELPEQDNFPFFSEEAEYLTLEFMILPRPGLRLFKALSPKPEPTGKTPRRLTELLKTVPGTAGSEMLRNAYNKIFPDDDEYLQKKYQKNPHLIPLALLKDYHRRPEDMQYLLAQAEIPELPLVERERLQPFAPSLASGNRDALIEGLSAYLWSKREDAFLKTSDFFFLVEAYLSEQIAVSDSERTSLFQCIDSRDAGAAFASFCRGLLAQHGEGALQDFLEFVHAFLPLREFHDRPWDFSRPALPPPLPLCWTTLSEALFEPEHRVQGRALLGSLSTKCFELMHRHSLSFAPTRQAKSFADIAGHTFEHQAASFALSLVELGQDYSQSELAALYEDRPEVLKNIAELCREIGKRLRKIPDPACVIFIGKVVDQHENRQKILPLFAALGLDVESQPHDHLPLKIWLERIWSRLDATTRLKIAQALENGQAKSPLTQLVLAAPPIEQASSAPLPQIERLEEYSKALGFCARHLPENLKDPADHYRTLCLCFGIDADATNSLPIPALQRELAYRFWKAGIDPEAHEGQILPRAFAALIQAGNIQDMTIFLTRYPGFKPSDEALRSCWRAFTGQFATQKPNAKIVIHHLHLLDRCFANSICAEDASAWLNDSLAHPSFGLDFWDFNNYEATLSYFVQHLSQDQKDALALHASNALYPQALNPKHRQSLLSVAFLTLIVLQRDDELRQLASRCLDAGYDLTLVEIAISEVTSTRGKIDFLKTDPRYLAHKKQTLRQMLQGEKPVEGLDFYVDVAIDLNSLENQVPGHTLDWLHRKALHGQLRGDERLDAVAWAVRHDPSARIGDTFVKTLRMLVKLEQHERYEALIQGIRERISTQPFENHHYYLETIKVVEALQNQYRRRNEGKPDSFDFFAVLFGGHEFILRHPWEHYDLPATVTERIRAFASYTEVVTVRGKKTRKGMHSIQAKLLAGLIFSTTQLKRNIRKDKKIQALETWRNGIILHTPATGFQNIIELLRFWGGLPQNMRKAYVLDRKFDPPQQTFVANVLGENYEKLRLKREAFAQRDSIPPTLAERWDRMLRFRAMLDQHARSPNPERLAAIQEAAHGEEPVKLASQDERRHIDQFSFQTLQKKIPPDLAEALVADVQRRPQLWHDTGILTRLSLASTYVTEAGIESITQLLRNMLDPEKTRIETMQLPDQPESEHWNYHQKFESLRREFEAEGIPEAAARKFLEGWKPLWHLRDSSHPELYQYFRATHDIERGMKFAEDPEKTCQALTSFSGDNDDAEPINRSLLPQFNLLEFCGRGGIFARTLLEVVMRGEGKNKRLGLLVEKIYPRELPQKILAVLKEDIRAEYSAFLGIPREDVLFWDEIKPIQDVPLNVAYDYARFSTPLRIHNDTFR